MRKIVFLTGVTGLLFLAITAWRFWPPTTPSTPAGEFQTDTKITTTTSNEAGSIPNDMTSEKLGQLFIIGHWAHTPVASTTNLIQEHGVGGVIIMSAPEDPATILDWTREWQAVSPTNLLIAIDQEGGPVSRLRGDGFIQTGQREITSPEIAYTVGLTRGRELAALGINLNFAPVLDTTTNPDSFMYQRVFHERSTSHILAAELNNGLAAAGVTGVVKHFPGHDDTSDDSHLTLPTVPYSGAALVNFLSPFASLLETNPPAALMTAHVAFPSVDPLPATLSPYWLTTYLREELNYTGVVITDDIIMDAIDDTWPHESASVMSLKAGADIILYAAEPEKVADAIKAVAQSLEAGELPPARIDEALARIGTLQNRQP